MARRVFLPRVGVVKQIFTPVGCFSFLTPKFNEQSTKTERKKVAVMKLEESVVLLKMNGTILQKRTCLHSVSGSGVLYPAAQRCDQTFAGSKQNK